MFVEEVFPTIEVNILREVEVHNWRLQFSILLILHIYEVLLYNFHDSEF